MADDAPTTNPHPFDVRTIRHLVALMSRHDLNEIDLRHGESRICLRRGVALGDLPLAPAAPAHAPAASPAPPVPAAADRPPARKLHEIKSPTVGTVYLRPKPDAEPYVAAGSRVTPTTVVCQIEAMKIFNEITADCTGIVAEVTVENGQAVEFDTVLFRVDTSA